MIDCIVPVSGGKDSQACLVLAIEKFGAKNVIGLFCDTQFEHPLTYRHIEFMRKYYDVPIASITAGSVFEKVRKYQRWPGFGSRHCTDELKIVPSKKYYKAMAECLGTGFQVWLGMRTGESKLREKRYGYVIDTELYEPHIIMRKFPKYLARLGVMFALPIVDWSEREVFELLKGAHNPLYNDGFDRVGCFPCLAGGDEHKAKAFSYDATGRAHYIDVQTIEIEIGESVWTSKRGRSGCMVCSI